MAIEVWDAAEGAGMAGMGGRPGCSPHRWTAAQKRAIVLESLEVRASAAAIARRHDISIGQFYRWRQQRLRQPLGIPAAADAPWRRMRLDVTGLTPRLEVALPALPVAAIAAPSPGRQAGGRIMAADTTAAPANGGPGPASLAARSPGGLAALTLAPRLGRKRIQLGTQLIHLVSHQQDTISQLTLVDVRKCGVTQIFVNRSDSLRQNIGNHYYSIQFEVPFTLISRSGQS